MNFFGGLNQAQESFLELVKIAIMSEDTSNSLSEDIAE